MFGLRKFGLIKTTKGIGFIRGKRRSGYFNLTAVDTTVLTEKPYALRNMFVDFVRVPLL